MKILFDVCVPRPLFRALTGHSVKLAQELGWSELRNGDLIAAAGNADFDLFITADQSIQYQQHIRGRRIAILVLPTNSWIRLRRRATEILQCVNSLQPGEFFELPR